MKNSQTQGRCIDHRTVILFAMVGFLVLSVQTAQEAGADTYMDPARVLVVYKTTSADNDKNGMGDSEQLARYYATKRNVPLTNLLGLSITTSNYYYYLNEYTKFYAEMVSPIKDKLDSLGQTNIDVILLAGDLPTTVYDASNSFCCIDNALIGLFALGSTSSTYISKSRNPYYEYNPTFGADLGHFSHDSYKFNDTNMYLVSRLGSNNSLRGIEQIDQSLYADRYLYAQPGYYYGNAYVDTRFGQPNGSKYTDSFLASQSAVQAGDYSSYAKADMNMAYAEHYIISSGLPLKWENTTTSINIGKAGTMFSDGTSAELAPRALFYGGWYNYGNYNDVFEWLPGSVAIDLNSGSTFGMAALNHGASAAAYVIDEPYLDGHQRPNVLYYYLLNGYNFAEASMLSTPTINWMEMNEGDPLYAPLQNKTPITDTQLPVLSAGYPQVVTETNTGNALVKLQISDMPEPEVVTAKVEYGLDTSYGDFASSAPAFRRAPSVSVPMLAGKTYHYRVYLIDPSGNTTVSDDYTHTTSDISILYGDVDLDGNISAEDALLALRHATNILPLLTGNALIAADVDDDDGITDPQDVNAEDALMILQYSANIRTRFPVQDRNL